MLKYIFLFIIPFSAFGQISKNVNLLFNWNDTTLVGSSQYDNTYNEVWGVAINGREYAIIGSTAGTHIFDVTDPVNAYLADFVPGAAQGGGIVHRDYDDYKGFLYMVCDEGASTLQIADLNYLPDSVKVVYDSDALFKTSHNTFIDTAKAKLYVCGPGKNSSIQSLFVYSLKDPVNPKFIYSYSGTDYVHDCYVRNDTAYLNAGAEGLRIVDFSDTLTYVTLGSLTTYPYQGYNHSGDLSENGKYYIFCDENAGNDLKIYDVSDPSDLKLMDTFNSGVDPGSIVHNVLIKGDFAYCSYYFDGARIFYIGDPSNVVQTGYYDTYPENDYNMLYKGSWGVFPYLPSGILLAADMQYGLFVLDPIMALNAIPEQEYISSDLDVYPNPFSEKIIIKGFSPYNSFQHAEIFSMDGRKLFEFFNDMPQESYCVTVPQYIETGILILKISTQKNIFVKKLVRVSD